MKPIEALRLRYASLGGGGPAFVTSDLVMYLDASESASYPGSGQTWANLVASPADGSAQTAYDWQLGSSSGADGSDPPFTSAGSASYFQIGGSSSPRDYFELLTSTAFLNSLHKDGAAFTIEIWCYFDGTNTGVCPVFDNGSSDQGGPDMSRGLLYPDFGSNAEGSQTPGRHRLRVKQNSGANTALAAQNGTTLTGGNILMLACSVDEAGGGVSFLYRNGAIDQVGGNDTFDAAYTLPSTNNAANTPKIGVRGDATQGVVATTRIYLIRIYNAALTSTELLQNWNATKGRFGL